MNRSTSLSGLGAFLSQQHWRRLLELGSLVSYQRGNRLLREGEQGHVVLVLLDGRVKISVSHSDGFELPITVRLPGEVLGDIAVLDDRPRTATVVAIDRCTVRTVPATDFQRFVTANELSPVITQHSIERLREAELRRIELITVPLEQRLCRVLLRFAAEGERGRLSVDLNMSQEELGRMVGASRNAIGGVLSRLRGLAIVDTSPRAVVIRDLAALRRYANSDPPD